MLILVLTKSALTNSAQAIQHYIKKSLLYQLAFKLPLLLSYFIINITAYYFRKAEILLSAKSATRGYDF